MKTTGLSINKLYKIELQGLLDANKHVVIEQELLIEDITKAESLVEDILQQNYNVDDIQASVTELQESFKNSRIAARLRDKDAHISIDKLICEPDCFTNVTEDTLKHFQQHLLRNGTDLDSKERDMLNEAVKFLKSRGDTCSHILDKETLCNICLISQKDSYVTELNTKQLDFSNTKQSILSAIPRYWIEQIAEETEAVLPENLDDLSDNELRCLITKMQYNKTVLQNEINNVKEEAKQNDRQQSDTQNGL